MAGMPYLVLFTLIEPPHFGIFVLGASDPDLHHASRNEDDSRELVSRPEQAGLPPDVQVRRRLLPEEPDAPPEVPSSSD